MTVPYTNSVYISIVILFAVTDSGFRNILLRAHILFDE